MTKVYTIKDLDVVKFLGLHLPISIIKQQMKNKKSTDIYVRKDS